MVNTKTTDLSEQNSQHKDVERGLEQAPNSPGFVEEVLVIQIDKKEVNQENVYDKVWLIILDSFPYR